MQYLYLSLLERLLLRLELVLEFLHGVHLARGDVPAPVDVTKTAATDELLLLELVPEDGLALR